MNKHDRIQKIKEMLANSICKYEACSDGDDKQYPECAIINKDSTYHRCPATRFGISELAKRIDEEIKALGYFQPKEITVNCGNCENPMTKTDEVKDTWTDFNCEFCNAKVTMLFKE